MALRQQRVLRAAPGWCPCPHLEVEGSRGRDMPVPPPSPTGGCGSPAARSGPGGDARLPRCLWLHPQGRPCPWVLWWQRWLQGEWHICPASFPSSSSFVKAALPGSRCEISLTTDSSGTVGSEVTGDTGGPWGYHTWLGPSPPWGSSRALPHGSILRANGCPSPGVGAEGCPPRHPSPGPHHIPKRLLPHQKSALGLPGGLLLRAHPLLSWRSSPKTLMGMGPSTDPDGSGRSLAWGAEPRPCHALSLSVLLESSKSRINFVFLV